MLQHKAYKFRLYPNKEQQTLIVKTIGSSRFVFNYFLDRWQKEYDKTGKGLSYYKCSSMLPIMKKDDDTKWLSEVDSIALQSSLRHLSDSFDRFFKKQNHYPKFKSKRNPVQSYTTKNNHQSMKIDNNHIKLPKLGWVRFSKSRHVQGRLLNATISIRPNGCFYISILCEEDIQPLPKTHSSIGIDLGINDFAILSDGQKIDNHRFTKQMEQKLKREQRKLSRKQLLAKQKGLSLDDCKNYQKQKIRVAKLYQKVVNQRTDFLNKLSTTIIKNHDIICIENLNTKGMLKNHKLAKSISDVSWSSFVTKLEYKANWYGKEVIKIDTWFPSSQICSNCGHRDGKKSLDIREWECSYCHSYHDRDVNASLNILNEGLRINSILHS